MFGRTGGMDGIDTSKRDGIECDRYVSGSGPKVATFSLRTAGAALGPDKLDEAACRLWVLHQLHPEGARCPACGAPVNSGRPLASWQAMKRVCCNSCGKYFTAATGTILQKMKISVRQLMLIAWGLCLGLGISHIAGICGVDESTVWHWRVKLECLDGGAHDAD